MNARLLLDKLAARDTVDFDWDNDAMHDLEGVPAKRMPVSELKWHFTKKFWSKKGKVGAEGGDLSPDEVMDDPEEYPDHAKRIEDADLSFPLDLWKNQAGRWIILDGLHRLAKAFLLGKKEVEVKEIPPGRKSEILGENLFDADAARERVERLRAGDRRSKNRGTVYREPPTGPLRQVDLPVSVFSEAVLAHLRDSTDPERVAGYGAQRIADPIYCKPGRRGSWVVVDGGHRLLAAIDRGDQTVPALIPATVVTP